MNPTVAEILCGIHEIDRMEQELRQITTMFFGFIESPGEWIHAHRLDHNWNNFHTQFGSYETDGCVWDIWYEDEFYTRCLTLDKNKTPLISYGTRRYSHTLPSVSCKEPRIAGILKAHAGLQVFVDGMMSEFPLRHRIGPFLEAAHREQ